MSSHDIKRCNDKELKDIIYEANETRSAEIGSWKASIVNYELLMRLIEGQNKILEEQRKIITRLDLLEKQKPVPEDRFKTLDYTDE